MYDSSIVCHQCDHPPIFDFIGAAQNYKLRTDIREVPISADDIDNGLVLHELFVRVCADVVARGGIDVHSTGTRADAMRVAAPTYRWRLISSLPTSLHHFLDASQ
jgi:hypothetical protein